MLLSPNNQLRSKDVLWKQSATTSSSVRKPFREGSRSRFCRGPDRSDAGGLVLRELDRRYRFAENVGRWLHDPREGHKVKHDLLTLVRQRLFAIAQGYEDNNDAATLAKDPAFKIMAGKAPESGPDLASQPTPTRLRTGSPPRTYAASPIGCWTCTSRPIPAPGRLSSWTWTPPCTPPTGSSNSASSMVITKSTCIIRSSSLTAGTDFPGGSAAPRQHPLFPRRRGVGQG